MTLQPVAKTTGGKTPLFLLWYQGEKGMTQLTFPHKSRARTKAGKMLPFNCSMHYPQASLSQKKKFYKILDLSIKNNNDKHKTIKSSGSVLFT